ncbi:MAG TPA: DUF411 domain-containing protein [Bosea sp. (in: a-proteobacteria)]|jgi:hypothetical protein|nr:DUF411 domain-containing protein [Bosea sp. (in: a-proteobacteria)]
MAHAALAASAITEAAAATEGLPRVTVTRDPNCGCCIAWVEHMRASGFAVEVVEIDDVVPLKVKLGVPEALMSCHTSQVGSYVIEGHVPADAVKRLLAEHPDAAGIAVAGMPIGSPGMEIKGEAPRPYEVVIFASGRQNVFARYRGIFRI